MAYAGQRCQEAPVGTAQAGQMGRVRDARIGQVLQDRSQVVSGLELPRLLPREGPGNSLLPTASHMSED